MTIEGPRIFLSYARKDIADVRALYQQLKRAGFRPWMDVEDLLPGEKWESAVKDVLEKASFFIACLSEHSVSHRGAMQMEFKEAFEVARHKLGTDIHLIPVRLDDEHKVPADMKKYSRVNLFDEDGLGKLIKTIREGIEVADIGHLSLRSEPLDNLSREDVNEMLQEKNFYDSRANSTSQGMQHSYEEIIRRGEKLILDHTISLTWQQSGSDNSITFRDAQKYVRELREQNYAGYSDWRLPTLEEAMSLMEPARISATGRLFIASLFDENQRWIWTADKESAAAAWVVVFGYGYCDLNLLDFHGHLYVRAVRKDNL